MDTQNEENTVPVSLGFGEKFAAILKDEDVSFREIGRMLIFQSRLVAHLLVTANEHCKTSNSSLRPKSVGAITSVLGLENLMKTCMSAKSVSFAEQESYCEQSVEDYALAVVLSELAERKLGRAWTKLGRDGEERIAPDFFLIGLISSAVEENRSILDDCNEDITRHFNGNVPEGHPTLSDARDLVEAFIKGNPNCSPEIWGIWESARLRAREALDVLAK